MVFRRFLDSDVRQRDGGIRIYSLTAALELVTIVRRSSTEVNSFVVETIGTSSISGSSWAQKYVREMQDSEISILSPVL